MAGMSAWSDCWFESCTTDSFGPTLRLHGALGSRREFLPHYHGEGSGGLPLDLVGHGELPAGYAADDGAALVFRDRAIVEVVTSDPAAGAWRVEPDGAGGAVETALPTRFLGA
jgi:hypothetical protein